MLLCQKADEPYTCVCHLAESFDVTVCVPITRGTFGMTEYICKIQLPHECSAHDCIDVLDGHSQALSHYYNINVCRC